MSENGGSQLLPYPQTKLRISATYPAGDTAPPGRPESVEIELNDDAVPGDPAERTVFITELVAALFRGLPADNHQYKIEFQPPAAGVRGAAREVRPL